jgi:hypothetical protein
MVQVYGTAVGVGVSGGRVAVGSRIGRVTGLVVAAKVAVAAGFVAVAVGRVVGVALG